MVDQQMHIYEHCVDIERLVGSHQVSSAQMHHEPPVQAVEEQAIAAVRKAALDRDLTPVGQPHVIWRAEVVWPTVRQPDSMSDDQWDEVIARFEPLIVEAIERLCPEH